MPAKLFGAAAEFIEAKYGGHTAETVDVVSVGVVQATVLRNDPERVFALFVNLSPNTIFIGFDQLVGAARGILLPANGGSYQVDVEEDFTIPIRAHFALASAAASNLYVLSVRRISKIVVEVE